MLRIELNKLISKLNSQTKLCLEQAASLCIEKNSTEVTIEHFLTCVLDNPLSDVRIISSHFNLDSERFKQELDSGYISDNQLDTYPSFSPLLIELLQESWLLCTTEFEQDDLRSGAIFLAAILRPERYLNLNVVSFLSDINKEEIRKNFHEILCESSETSSNIKLTKDKPVNTTDGYLNKFCENISKQAKDGKIDPVLCRDEESNLIIDILCRRRKNNPIIVGEPGVGKSAVIEGLALKIASGQVPEQLKAVEIWSLDLGLLQAGASVKGEFEKRLKGVINEVKSAPQPIIIFIDEAHTLIGSGNHEGGSDAANLLKPALARGELSAIAATTWKEYKKYFEKDPALTRRFQLVKLDEPSIEQSVDILRGLSSVYEKAHNVFITDEALKAASELSARYISGRQLPDKAIDVLDTACARIAINMTAPPKRIAELDSLKHQRRLEIDLINRSSVLGESVNSERLDELLTQHEFEESERNELEAQWNIQKDIVADIHAIRQSILSPDLSPDSEQTLLSELNKKYEQLNSIAPTKRLVHPHVTSQQIAEVISDWTGVPLNQMSHDELHKITNLSSILSQSIKGQGKAIASIHQHLLTATADLRRPGRPKGAFLLVGPSGVGKTETVIQIAEQLYGGKQFLTTINMSEYQEKHTVSRLIGSPPGYVGYGEGGVLTEAIRKMPYSIVLLDEVEKAHPEVLNIFYQAFDKGELADGEGRLIDCQNVVFFLTSNLGYQTIVDNAQDLDGLNDKLYPELAAYFKPALLARMESIPYLPLTQETLREIAYAKLNRLTVLFQQRYGAEFIVTDEVIEDILLRATRSENGARIIETIIDGKLLPPISLEILKMTADDTPINRILVSVEDNEFIGEVE